MMTEKQMIEAALKIGFSKAALISTVELVVQPEFRKYCEENLCGCYDVVPACPPQSGTVEEMEKRFRRYSGALVLQTVVSPEDGELFANPKKAKLRHNELTGKLIAQLRENGMEDSLLMSAGPWKNNSCMSAYCVNAQKMADAAGMQCWVNDGRYRYFSTLCFDPE